MFTKSNRHLWVWVKFWKVKYSPGLYLDCEVKRFLWCCTQGQSMAQGLVCLRGAATSTAGCYFKTGPKACVLMNTLHPLACHPHHWDPNWDIPWSVWPFVFTCQLCYFKPFGNQEKLLFWTFGYCCG